jgi:hypothetical protein
MKPTSEINWKFILAFFGFFAIVLFIPLSDYIFTETFNFLKYINFEYCVSFIYGLIIVSFAVIIFKIVKQIKNNLSNGK